MRTRIAETLTKNGAIIAGLVTAIVAVVQLTRGVSQSERDLEWKQADQGRSLVEAMLNDRGWDAMTMLDFKEGRMYEISPGESVLIRPSDVAVALSLDDLDGGPRRTDTQRFIIDRYDRLFFLVSRLQVAVQSGLVRKDDVAFPLSWYVEKRLCKNKQVAVKYMRANSAPETVEFFESLDDWQKCPAAIQKESVP